MPFEYVNGKTYSVIYDHSGVEISRQEISVADEKIANEQRSSESQTQFFQERAQDTKNRMKRVEQVQKQVEQLVSDMITPPKSPEFRSISDDAYQQLIDHPEAWEEEGFTPLKFYAH